MRCYHLNNFYLAGIHAGIQSAHAQHELAITYVMEGEGYELSEIGRLQRESYIKWATDHKTIIVLNGGMQADLEKWTAFLASSAHPYAWSFFREEQAALNGAMTNVCVVLPPKMYTYTRDILRVVNSGEPSNGFWVHAIETPELEVRVKREGDEFVVTRYTFDQTETLAEVAEKWTYTKFDIELMSRLSRCNLM